MTLPNADLRSVHFASRLTGWNAIKSRVEQLELPMTDAQIKLCTQKVKDLADTRPLAIDDVDSVIRSFYQDIPVTAEKTSQEQARPAKAEMDLALQYQKEGLGDMAANGAKGILV